MLTRYLRLFCLLIVAGLTGACGTVEMGKPSASIDNIRLAKSSGMEPVSVGSFQPAQGKSDVLEKPLVIRATQLAAPGGSFSGYLKETLETELLAAGLLNSAANLKVEGFLTDRQVDGGMGEGSASLSARFIVSRGNRQVYDRELGVKATWDSSFAGAVAIPAAINEFTLLYRKLVGRLLSDPEFVSAVKPR